MTGYLDLGTADTAGGIADRALGEIEITGKDSKLEAFIYLLRLIESLGIPSTRICVLTEYANSFSANCEMANPLPAAFALRAKDERGHYH